MDKTLVIARKEIGELFNNKSTVLMGLGFALFFSVLKSLAIIKGEGSTAAMSLDSSLFFVSAAIGFFMAYFSSSQIFLREKMDRVIETLLCAPVDLRQIWLGKVLGVTALAYSLSLLSALVILLISNILSGSLLLPSAHILVHVLLVVPTLIAALAGLLGFVQFRLGMRENRILNLVIFAPAFVALYGVGLLSATSSLAITWAYVGLLFAISILVLATSAYLTGRLSKERIVTTLP